MHYIKGQIIMTVGEDAQDLEISYITDRHLRCYGHYEDLAVCYVVELLL